MDVRAPRIAPSAAVWLRISAALLVGLTGLLPFSAGVLAAESDANEASSPDGVVIDARALVGGHVRPGAWAAVNVFLANDGPSISGELRIRSQQQNRSQYGVVVELPSGARQEHVVYARPPVFGSRLHVDFVAGDQLLLSKEVAIRSHDAWSPTIAIVAERPEGIQAAIGETVRNPHGPAVSVITLSAADLPPRVEAWSVIDRLVWQDVDAGSLEPEQVEALRQWVGAGGQLVIVAGTSGVGPIAGFPSELLPFRPTQTVQVSADDVISLVGRVLDRESIPALSGPLREGKVLARSGEGDVIAAQLTWGQGAVTLTGLNPAERWLADGNAGRTLWRRLLPLGSDAAINPLSIADDATLISTLNSLPEVDLPPIDQLFMLLFAYVVLIGPVNYLILRRLDKREWAWVTMPLLVAVFSVGSYGLGATIKGSDVIVNQVAIVRAGQGTGEGLGQVYVGVFSPARRTFEVRVPDGALLSSATSPYQFDQAEQPLDVLFGDPSRLRNFEVGFGVLRGFRAEAATYAPMISSDLRLVRGMLEGTVTNDSDDALEHVALVLGNTVAVLSNIEPGATRTVALDTTSSSFFAYSLAERIFGSTFPRDRSEARVVFTRRTVIEQLAGHGAGLGGSATDKPILLAWQQRPALTVELTDERPNHVGDSLYVVPLGMVADHQAVFGNQMITKTVLDSSGEGWGERDDFYVARGTMVIEARPAGFEGRFRVASLELAVSGGDVRDLSGNGALIEPLPDSEQPDQDDPLGDAPDPFGQPRWEDPPDLQLYDHQRGLWFEFQRPVARQSYLVAEPERFVDESGRVLARFVNRGGIHEQKWFSFMIRLEGTIE